MTIAAAGMALSFAAGGAGPAFAADPAAAGGRYKKKEVEIQGVAQTALTKPATPGKDQKQGGPVLTIDEFLEKKQGEIIKLTDKQIDQMKRLIRVTGDDDPQKPDFNFRLGELYAEKQRYSTFSARALDEKIFNAKTPAEKQKLTAQQQAHEKESEQWLLLAVQQYVEASKSKKYERMDEVLFRLAFLLQQVKREEQAREFFHRLIKDYPNSKYVPDAYLSFGEYYFGEGQMDAALKFYEKVEQFPDSPVYGYAVYKKGWCWINLGDFKQALEVFVNVIRLTKSGKIGGKQAKALEREAKKDVVKAYARTPGATPDKAWEFFKRVGDDFAPRMMESLGEIYWEQGMFVDSTKVYRKIIALNPESVRVCEWQNKVMRNTLSSGTKRDQVQELGRLGLAYERTQGAKDVKQDVLSECRNVFHDTARELALIWHKEAQRTKNDETYELTKYVYKLYFKYFTGDKDALDMAFYYAEVLWVTETWLEAAEQYTKVVQMDQKSKYVREAAYAAVLAWKNYLNIDDAGQGPDKEKQPAADKEFKPRPIPDVQQKMIAAFDTYITYVPDSPELVKIKYRKARIYYEYNHFKDAAVLFEDIVDRHINDELAIYSANLLLDCLNLRGDTGAVIATVDKFIQNPVLMKDEEFRKQMIMIKTDSYVMEGKRFEKEANYKECALSMLAAAESVPEHPKHAERMYDAALCFQKARLVGQAIRVRQDLIKTHPGSPLSQKALFQIASGYHQLASYTNAADYYEQFATKFPGETEAAKALGNATTFRIGLGEFEKAISDMNAFIKFYGARKPAEAADVFFQMGDVYERQAKAAELARHLETYLRNWGAKGGVDKNILAHFKLGEMAWKRSCPQEGVNGACIKVERVTATGRQKAYYEINKKVKDRRKKVKPPQQTTCGPPTRSKITVYVRNKTAAAEAQKHFDTVLKLFANGAALAKIPGQSEGEKQQRAALASYAAAGALFYKGEAVFEDFLRVQFPGGLDFQQPTQWDTPREAKEKKKRFEESTKKFLQYMTEKAKLAEKLAGPSAEKKGVYDNVLDFKVAHWTIAASARIGHVWANFTDQLYTAEIPKDLVEEDKWGNRPREIFCDALADKAEPLEAKAVQGYEICLKAATQQSWYNEWSKLCEVELNQMQPSEYPLAAEARPDAGYVSTLMTPAPLASDLPEAKLKIAVAK